MSTKTDQIFDYEYEEIVSSRTQALCWKMALPIIVLYLVLDNTINRSDWLVLTTSHLIMAFIVMAFAILARRSYLSNQTAMYFLGNILAGLVVLQEHSTSIRLSQTYYSNGNILILLSVLGAVPWKSIKYSLFTAISISSIFLVSQFFSVQSLTYEDLAVKFVFDLSIIIITGVSNQAFYRSKLTEFNTRQLLATEIETRNEIIERQVSEIMRQNLTIREKESLADLAAQVAHDIRSPLTALELATADLSALPEDRRGLVRQGIQRVNDIANNLLAYRRRLGTEAKSDQAKQTRTLIVRSLIDAVISERRENLSAKNIHLTTSLPTRYPPAFTDVPADAISNAISNCLQNAIDASKLGSTVEVLLEVKGGVLEVAIKDSGPGIPPHVLNLLTKEPITHGKVGGNGIGIFASSKRLRELGGEIRFESLQGQGTKAITALPAAPPPQWLATVLPTHTYKKIVVADDDHSIHRVWDSRIGWERITHLHSLAEMDRWIKTNPTDGILFLVDYEFTGDPRTGFDFIIENKLEGQSVLVTSRFDDQKVLAKCLRRNVKLVPKFLAGSIPVV
jgi:signal transduction histidine kinase